MRTKALLGCMILLIISSIISLAQDDEQIIATMNNYAGGAYGDGSSLMAAALCNDIQKVIVQRLPNGAEAISYTTNSLLVAGAEAGLIKMPADQRNLSITVVDRFTNLASVRLNSAKFIDLVSLAKINGDWKIVQVVWGTPAIASMPENADDPGNIKAAVENYIDGLYSSDLDRIVKSVHPELHHAMLSTLRGTELQYIYLAGRGFLEVDAKAKMTAVPEGERGITIKILQTVGNIASVRLESRVIKGYVQLVKLNGVWQVINVLWMMNP